MPFSMVIYGVPKQDALAAQLQGPALQGMFLHLIEQVDPAVSARLHDENAFRPYTLSPLGIGERGRQFQGFQLPRYDRVRVGTPCYLRVTLLLDDLFPTICRYFLESPTPVFRLGETEFSVTNVLASPENDNPWSYYLCYEELIERNLRQYDRRIKLRFLTPTSFSKGDVDLPLPLPRLVFQAYLKRFQEFHTFPFLPDFLDLVDLHTGISSLRDLRTDTLKTKRIVLTGFTGDVSFELSKQAPPELIRQMHLLADFAFFCGTGKKTTVGMGQTVKFIS